MTNADIAAFLDAASASIAQARTALAAPASFYTSISDRVVRPKPTLPTLGPAGFAFTDPTFGSKMLRVTDAGLGAGSWRVPSNAHLSAWSADGLKFFVVGEGGVIPFTFDPVAFTATPLALRPYSQTEPQFSRTDPNALYVVAGPSTRTLRKVTFPSGTVSDVVDLDTVVSGLIDPRTYVGGILSAGSPEVLVAFFGGQGQDAHHYVLWYPVAGGPYKLLETVARANCHLHSVSMDLSGRYVLLYPTNAQPFQVIVWDTTTDTLTPITSTMAPGGHDSVGYGVWVNQDVASGAWDGAQWTMRSLATPATYANLISPILTPKEVYFSDHSSWNHAKPNASLPVISSTYRFYTDALPTPSPLPANWPAGVTPAPWRPWDDEIIAIATDGSGTVNRFAHHRSDIRDEANPLNPYFWYEPIANVSPDGRSCLFHTNQEKTLGADPQDAGRSRQDVFLVQLR